MFCSYWVIRFFTSLSYCWIEDCERFMFCYECCNLLVSSLTNCYALDNYSVFVLIPPINRSFSCANSDILFSYSTTFLLISPNSLNLLLSYSFSRWIFWFNLLDSSNYRDNCSIFLLNSSFYRLALPKFWSKDDILRLAYISYWRIEV